LIRRVFPPEDNELQAQRLCCAWCDSAVDHGVMVLGMFRRPDQHSGTKRLEPKLELELLAGNDAGGEPRWTIKQDN
jgi:hypothetical protein